MTELGLNEIQAGWRVEGEYDTGRLLLVCNDLIRFVKMTPAGEWVLRYYQPQQEKNGGLGVQGYRDLVESWIVFSTWPEHGFIRITLSSCKVFEPKLVTPWLEMRLGKIDKNGDYLL